MFYYLARLRYNGAGFCGFQWQKDLQTVQGSLNQSLARLLAGKFSTLGASRTDTGVHAWEQWVKITSEHALELERFQHQLAKALDPRLRLLGLSPCDYSFHPARSLRAKEYRYLFTSGRPRTDWPPLAHAHIAASLDLPRMQECLTKLSGVHRFHNFVSQGSNVRSVEREIYRCALEEVNPHELLPDPQLFPFPAELQRCHQLVISADGFLKQMVRHLVAALWLVGSGKLSPEDFAQLLQGPVVDKRLWRPAPASGLYLYRLSPSEAVQG